MPACLRFPMPSGRLPEKRRLNLPARSKRRLRGMTYLRTIHTLDCDRHRPKSHIRFRRHQLDSTPRMANAFFSDLLSTISERGRTLLRRGEPSVARPLASELLHLCKAVLSRRAEASGPAIAPH